jgi:glycosyltransferase involved in cell wall biosynthesis
MVVTQTNNLSIERQAMSDYHQALTIVDSKKLGSEQIKKIVWVVPHASAHSGGFRTLSRFISKFDSMSIQQEVAIYHPFLQIDTQKQSLIWRKDFNLPKNIPVMDCKRSNFENSFVFATGWQTVFFVLKNIRRDNRGWFVQDDESIFHQTGGLSVSIRDAFNHFDYAITAGPWLAAIAKEKGTQNIESFLFGSDEIYFQNAVTNSVRKRNVICYFQADKSWRGSFMALQSLEGALDKFPNWRGLLVGDDIAELLKLPKRIASKGKVSPVTLSYLYAESSIGICLSMSNASLVPLEMAAAGLPVLTNKGVQNEWIDYALPSNLKFVNLQLIELQSGLESLMKEVEDGYVFNPSNVPSWFEVLTQFVGNLEGKSELGGYYTLFDWVE